MTVTVDEKIVDLVSMLNDHYSFGSFNQLVQFLIKNEARKLGLLDDYRLWVQARRRDAGK